MQLHSFIENISHNNHGTAGGAVMDIRTLAGLFICKGTHSKSGMFVYIL